MAGAQGLGASVQAAISPDGRYIAFGTAAPNLVPGHGGGFNVVLSGPALLGGPGDDVLIVGSLLVGPELPLLVDGGPGSDTANLDALGPAIDLTQIADKRFAGVETLDLGGGTANTVTLGAQDVLALSSTTGTLLIKGDPGDAVVLSGAGWTADGTVVDPLGEVGTYVGYVKGGGDGAGGGRADPALTGPPRAQTPATGRGPLCLGEKIVREVDSRSHASKHAHRLRGFAIGNQLGPRPLLHGKFGGRGALEDSESAILSMPWSVAMATGPSGLGPLNRPVWGPCVVAGMSSPAKRVRRTSALFAVVRMLPYGAHATGGGHAATTAAHRE